LFLLYIHANLPKKSVVAAMKRQKKKEIHSKKIVARRI
jgi:hypothetical protein